MIGSYCTYLLERNWSTLLWLAIVHGFCAAVQGVRFPIELEGFKYEGVGVPATLYNNHDSKTLWLLRSEAKPDWFEIWIAASPNAESHSILTFKIVEMYSMVVNAISVYCNSTFPLDVMKIHMHFMSRDDARFFRYEEIFVKYTKRLSSQELGDAGMPVAPWQNGYFENELMDVLLYNNDAARRVAKNAIIERVPIRSKTEEVVSQFHIHIKDDGKLRSSDVIFVEGYFAMSHIVDNRIVLGIWANCKVTYHICLVFASRIEALDFYNSVFQYTQPSINIEGDRARALFSADLTNVYTIR